MQKFNRFLAPVIVGWTALLPIAVAAQTVTDSNLKFYKDLIVSTINGVIMPVLLAIALLLFFWGVFKYYIKGGDDESERSKGHQFILWAIIGFAVIISVWGLVNVVASILLPAGVKDTPPKYPTL